MEITLENTSTLGRRLTVQVPAKNLQSRYQVRMKEMAKNARLDGFRAGHVKVEILEQRFGKQLRQEILTKTLEGSLAEALHEKKLQVAGQPSLEPFDADSFMEDQEFKKDLIYTASFEVYPEITLGDLAGITLTKKKVNITEADVQTAIEKIRHHLGTWESSENPIAKGDKVIIDYESTIEGQPYKDSHAKEVLVEVGNSRFIEGFEAGLIGKRQGETVVLDLRFPKEWRLQELADKPVQFTVTITSVSTCRLAPLDEKLAKTIRAASASESDIQTKIRHDLETQCARQIQGELRDQAAEKVLAAVSFELPEALLAQECRFLHQDLHQHQSGDHDSASSCQEEHAGLAEQAKRRVALGLLLGEVIKRNQIQLDKNKLKERLFQMGENFPDSSYIEKIYAQSEALMNSLRQAVLTEQGLDWLVSQLSIQEEPSTVKELLGW